MTLNDLERCNSPYFAFFTEFDCSAGQIRHRGILSYRPIVSVNIVSQLQSPNEGRGAKLPEADDICFWKSCINTSYTLDIKDTLQHFQGTSAPCPCLRVPTTATSDTIAFDRVDYCRPFRELPYLSDIPSVFVVKTSENGRTYPLFPFHLLYSLHTFLPCRLRWVLEKHVSISLRYLYTE